MRPTTRLSGLEEHQLSKPYGGLATVVRHTERAYVLPRQFIASLIAHPHRMDVLLEWRVLADHQRDGVGRVERGVLGAWGDEHEHV